MRTALDLPTQALDEQERNFVRNIREHGWFRTSVFADDEGPGFSYSTGFWLNTGHPELLTFSLKRETTHDVFWDIYCQAEDGTQLAPGKRIDGLFGNGDAYAFSVARRFYPEHLGWNRFFYNGDQFPCLQIVWADRAGIFPWEAGFDQEFDGLQPDLTDNGWVAAILD